MKLLIDTEAMSRVYAEFLVYLEDVLDIASTDDSIAQGIYDTDIVFDMLANELHYLSIMEYDEDDVITTIFTNSVSEFLSDNHSDRYDDILAHIELFHADGIEEMNMRILDFLDEVKDNISNYDTLEYVRKTGNIVIFRGIKWN